MDEAQVAEAKVERWFAILRAIALNPGLSPEGLQAALIADPAYGLRRAPATLYDDVKTLKQRGLLDEGRHRQGYHLAGTGFAADELRVMLNGLRIQAEDLANPVARTLYDKLLRRSARTHKEQAMLTLAVEAIANRPVVRTTTEDFTDVMTHLREPILRGQRVTIKMSCARDGAWRCPPMMRAAA